jgi:hypothetical protein
MLQMAHGACNGQHTMHGAAVANSKVVRNFCAGHARRDQDSGWRAQFVSSDLRALSDSVSLDISCARLVKRQMRSAWACLAAQCLRRILAAHCTHTHEGFSALHLLRMPARAA